MKMLKLLLLSFLFSLTQVSLAADYVDLLNLSKYKEGDAVPALDEKIARYQPNIDRTTSENILSLKKVHLKRIDYFFIAQEEADGLIESSGIPKNDFKYIMFSDIMEGEKRYIMCSLKVSEETIEKLNQAIVENASQNKP